MERCGKCGGMTIREKFYARGETESYEAYRCPFCGDIVDDLILENRRFQPVAQKGRPAGIADHRGRG